MSPSIQVQEYSNTGISGRRKGSPGRVEPGYGGLWLLDVVGDASGALAVLDGGRNQIESNVLLPWRAAA